MKKALIIAMIVVLLGISASAEETVVESGKNHTLAGIDCVGIYYVTATEEVFHNDYGFPYCIKTGDKTWECQCYEGNNNVVVKSDDIEKSAGFIISYYVGNDMQVENQRQQSIYVKFVRASPKPLFTPEQMGGTMGAVIVMITIIVVVGAGVAYYYYRKAVEDKSLMLACDICGKEYYNNTKEYKNLIKTGECLECQKKQQ